MEGSVINQICASMDSFFDTEKKIGDYIVRNPKKVVDMTVGELAKECGVSEASVSRFCKRIELKGFHRWRENSWMPRMTERYLDIYLWMIWKVL